MLALSCVETTLLFSFGPAQVLVRVANTSLFTPWGIFIYDILSYFAKYDEYSQLIQVYRNAYRKTAQVEII